MSSSHRGDGPSPAFTRHVQDRYDTLQSLFDAGEDVRSVMAHPGWAHITRLLEDEVRELDRSLDGMTTPLPHPDMCLRHGRRGGLRGAAEAAHAIVSVSGREQARQRAKHEGTAEPVLAGG